MAGFNEVENMVTLFPVFDAFLFFGRSSPYPNRYAFPNLKRKFKADSMNPTVPNMTGYDEVKIIITSLPVLNVYFIYLETILREKSNCTRSFGLGQR